MLKILFVGLGGFLGAVARYLISLLVSLGIASTFPYATLLINILGCFLIGVVIGLDDAQSLFTANVRLLLVMGFLGGFTTFSTFGFETYTLIKHDYLNAALLNIFLQTGLALIAVRLGLMLAYAVTKSELVSI